MLISSARSAALALATGLVVGAPLPAHLSAQAAPLERGRAVRGTVAEGDTVAYALRVADSTFVLGSADQAGAAVAVRFLDAQGRQAGRFAGPGAGTLRFAVQLEEGGTYTVQVIALEDGTGDYTLTLERVEPIARDPRRLADQLMARFDGADTPGGVVRVWRDGRVLFSKAYGMANLAYGIPYREDTRTNIGSTTKQFTAFAVMLQAERGLLSLDDDIREHVPELPDFGQTITVRHLITHTSGLREFLNLLTMTGRRLDRGDWIDRAELIDIVKRQPALQNEPGAEWNYNNTAFGLAALIVERTSGRSFPDLMREEVFLPLGMTRTLVRPSPLHIVPDASEGYTPGPDGWLQIGDLGGAVGAGSIYTTVEDLQRWTENFADPKVGTRAIFDEMMTSYVLTNGEETGYGYGLGVGDHRGLRRVQHGGADVAHRSMLAWYPEIRAGVTAQSNHAGFVSGAVAFALAEAFFADAMEAPEQATGEAPAAPGGGGTEPWKPSADDLDDFAGRFFSEEIETFYTLSVEDGALVVRQRRMDEAKLTAGTRPDTFSGGGLQFTFERDRNGRVIGLYVANGRTRDVRFARVG